MSNWTRIYAAGWLIGFFMVLGFPANAFSDNLVQNGNFEDGLKGWTATAGTGEGMSVEIVPGPKGNYAKITATNPGIGSYLTQQIPAELIKGKRLYISVKAKADNVVLGAQPYSQAKITLEWTDSQGSHSAEIPFTGTFDWKRLTAVWDIGNNCTKATLHLGFHTCTGTVWWDDVIIALSPEEVASLTKSEDEKTNR